MSDLNYMKNCVAGPSVCDSCVLCCINIVISVIMFKKSWRYQKGNRTRKSNRDR